MWKPINEAPTDKWMLVFMGKSRYRQPHIAWKDDDGHFITQDDDMLHKESITHWCELPNPPEQND